MVQPPLMLLALPLLALPLLLLGAGGGEGTGVLTPRLPAVRFSSSPRGLSELAELNRSSAPTVHGSSLSALRGSPR